VTNGTDELGITSAAIDLGLSQLSTVTTSIDTADLKALGVMAFDAAMIAVVLALPRNDVGRHWWLALIGVSISILFGLWSLVARNEQLSLGPAQLYAEFGASSELEAKTVLLASLSTALDAARSAEAGKARNIALSVTLLIPTAVYSALIFAFWK
jgi:hypothetical protein